MLLPGLGKGADQCIPIFFRSQSPYGNQNRVLLPALLGAQGPAIGVQKWLEVGPGWNDAIPFMQAIIPDQNLSQALRRDDDVLASLHKLPQPAMDRIL